MSCEARKLSTHTVEIVPVELTRHPNADALSIIPVFGFSYVGRTEDWLGVSRAAYIPPDSLVDVTRPEFSFLAEQAKADGKVRVKAKRLRGVVSYGLLVPVPDDTPLGEDWAARLGVEHYEPPLRHEGGNPQGGLCTGGEQTSPPPVYFCKYDLESGRRYAELVFEKDEPIVLLEKLHGASSRYVYVDGTMYCGSRGEWKKEYPDYAHITVESLEPKVGREQAETIVGRLQQQARRKNMWWQALDATPSLRSFCESHPGMVVYGEVFGAIQDLGYGHKKGEVSFRAFDLMVDGRWLDFEEAYGLACHHGLPWVPIVGDTWPIPYDFQTVCQMAEGRSLIPGANHIREGVVVRPLKERVDKRVGRVCLKWVSGAYLERS